MYEKLERLRAEVERCKKRIEDDKAKLKLMEKKLQEAENSQILANIGALNLSPEQVAELLKLVPNGKLSSASIGNTDESENTVETNDYESYESEENEDEE
jgi:hypothetical protein